MDRPEIIKVYYYRGYQGVVSIYNGQVYGDVSGTGLSFDTDPIEDAEDRFREVVDELVGSW